MLEKKLSEDLILAMKSGNKVDVQALRYLISVIKNKKIEDRTRDRELADADVIKVIQKVVRQQKESIEQFLSGGRTDLVEKETGEMEVIAKYLPKEVSEDELRKIVKESIAVTGASGVKDMGKVIKVVMEKVSGGADGKVISQFVKEMLS
ncbi:MAG: GatB/YqeY domain-containing protein [Candidatus Omnitrophica bacterium]|nr:GatB/YqeY domain-containing protein [Candidatus Omnitrophota bacterium]